MLIKLLYRRYLLKEITLTPRRYWNWQLCVKKYKMLSLNIFMIIALSGILFLSFFKFVCVMGDGDGNGGDDDDDG